MSTQGLVPPSDLDAERSLLAALMLGDDGTGSASEAYAILEPQSFYRHQHGLIYEACRSLYDSQIAVDLVAVCARLREMGKLEHAGGQVELGNLCESAVTMANLLHYARIVREHWMRRQLIAVATAAAGSARDIETPVGSLLDHVAESVSSVALSAARREPRTMASLVRDEYRRLEAEASAHDDHTRSVTTGFRALDDKLGGMQRSEFLLLAGRPSMGKTALALAIARNAVLGGGSTALVISLEMRDSSLVRRELAVASGVDGQRLRAARRLRSDDWSQLAKAAGKLDTQKLLVLDEPRLTVADIRAHARRVKARRGLDLLVVDYLGLVTPVHRDSKREREVAEISAGFKALAKELDVPVLCLSQLNRDLDRRDQKRPKLSDLRDSGALEQDADVVMFVHREGYYDAKADQDVAEIIVAKQRTGPIGLVRVGWDGPTTRFYDLDRSKPQQQELI